MEIAEDGSKQLEQKILGQLEKGTVGWRYFVVTYNMYTNKWLQQNLIHKCFFFSEYFN